MTIDPATIQSLRDKYDDLCDAHYGDTDWAWEQIGALRSLLGELLQQIDAQSQDER